jgi:ComF family protein
VFLFLKVFLVDLLLPRRCLGCNKEGRYLCSSCRKTIWPLTDFICPVCERRSFFGRTHLHCQTKYSLDGLISFFPYKGLMRTAIGKLKYKFITDLADDLLFLIRHVVRTKNHFKYLKRFFPKKKTILIPIPLYWQRENWRGFNQSKLLGEKLAKYFHWQLRDDILIRQKATQAQVELRARQRQKNIQRAFKIKPNIQISQDSRILLFDDVWTTGSTLKEAAKVLKKAGFKKVYGLTICR